jgi:hypothetical protein
MFPGQVRYLTPYEEAAGLLHELSVEQDMLAARLGKIHLALSAELEQSLRPLIGQRITILRTDIPDKPYLFRVLAQEGKPSKQ